MDELVAETKLEPELPWSAALLEHKEKDRQAYLSLRTFFC